MAISSKDKNLIVTFAKGNKSAPFLYILFLTFIVMTILGGNSWDIIGVLMLVIYYMGRHIL